ncbi:putative protein Sip5/DA2 [Helianthus debilis subsp. tardiflorus]
MGNKLGRKRHLVDEKYTRPQGLYEHKDVDHMKLRKLILESKLAPCYPGADDDCSFDLDECPICFLYYPSLNRSRCCMKGICTECFLQMKPDSTLLSQPLIMLWSIEGGVKTKEEKGLEQIEEQRVIDAKIRMRLQEIQDEEERMQRRQDMSSSSGIIVGEEIVSTQPLGGSVVTNPSGTWQNRNDEVDLENIMLMEAIWLSFQEDIKHHYNYSDAAQLARYASEVHVSAAVAPQTESRSSPSPFGGLACIMATLDQHQAGVESSTYQRSMSMCNTRYVDSVTIDETDMIDESFEEQMMVAMAVSLSEALQ